MNKIIIPTGYMGSGSSAITDLISEFADYNAEQGSFEYVFLHCPNGVFDLEDKLLIGNNANRSDEAIHSFRNMMQQLYSTKLWWPGNYKKNLSPRFMELTNAYLDALIQYQPNDYWYMQEKMNVRMFFVMCVRKALRILSRGKIMLKKPLRYAPMQISFIEEQDFYHISKKYLKSIFQELGIEEKNLILDQLLLPHNLFRMDNYFEDEAECFVIDRDPRDVFISNKYVWAKTGEVVPYPTDAEEFCVYYKRIRALEKHSDNVHIHRFHFEDLIYHYEDSVQRVCDILGIDRKTHVDAGKHFDPSKSIHNTQLFRREEYRNEMDILERELKDYLYDFPYEKEVEMDKVF